MNRAQKEALKEKIDKLSPHEHTQIFEVIKRETDKYTLTQNGVYVSTQELTDSFLCELDRLVDFYIDQRKRLETRKMD